MLTTVAGIVGSFVVGLLFSAPAMWKARRDGKSAEKVLDTLVRSVEHGTSENRGMESSNPTTVKGMVRREAEKWTSNQVELGARVLLDRALRKIRR